jgi:simple sugar transport system substrate-binding protein
MGRKAQALLLLLCALLAVGIVACGGSDKSTSQAGSTTKAAAGGGEVSSGKKLKFIYVGNSPSNIPTAAHIISGTKAADAVYGTSTEYRGPHKLTFDPNDARRAYQNALAQKPDGVISSNIDPTALNPSIKAINAAGIPVVLVNAGLGQTANVGALTYVGNDEFATGEVGGKKLGALGAKHALLLTGQPGLPLVDMRNDGFKKGFPGKVTVAAIPLKDLGDSTKVRNVTEATLQKDSSIDSVFVIGDCCSAAVLSARNSMGARAQKIHWSTIDLGEPVLKAVKSGQLDFALDQQPWMQGFLAVQTLALNIRYGFRPGSPFVATGPVVADKSNIDQILELTQKGIR